MNREVWEEKGYRPFWLHGAVLYSIPGSTKASPQNPLTSHHSRFPQNVPYLCHMKPVGDGTRILNFLVDTLLVFTMAYYSFGGWNWYVRYWGYPPYRFGWFFFGILFAYYFLFESIFGRTPGKWLSQSKVVSNKGKRASVGLVFVRSLVRLTIIDLFFIPFLGKPLHDYLSRTQVVEA